MTGSQVDGLPIAMLGACAVVIGGIFMIFAFLLFLLSFSSPALITAVPYVVGAGGFFWIIAGLFYALLRRAEKKHDRYMERIRQGER